VADAASLSHNWKKIAFLDDKYPDLRISGQWPVLGSLAELEELSDQYRELAVGLGDNGLRIRVQVKAAAAGYRIATVIHPSACIAQDVEIGEGCVVLANAVINTGSRLGSSVIVNTSAAIDHDNVISDGVHISPGARLGGNVVVGRCSWIGIGASVIHDRIIGSNAMIGAGAAVIRDVADGTTVVGVPATPTSEQG
jgi:sugar O-acyltransferase (sialic acid O-acetyltransferase NeuD family)